MSFVPGRVVALSIVAVLVAAFWQSPAAAQSPSPSPTSSPSGSPSPSPDPSPTPSDPAPSPSPTEDPQPEPEPEPIEATARVHIRNVELFGRAVVSGRVTPRKIDVRPVVKLRRNGKTIKERRVRLKSGRFKIRFKIAKPGSYRARVVVAGPGIRRAVADSGSSVTAMPSLSQGATGKYVERLEKRLRYLGYYIPSADRSFGAPTSDALIAFNKVQRTARVGYVTEDTWRRLASPIRPKPKFGSKWHFEIDQTRQVIFVVKRSKVRWIMHTSTGAGGATRDGTFTVHRKLAGYSPGRLYYPSYWDGLRAFHGWPEVPTYNASHGCARVPMWAAQWLYGLAQIGDTVYVYH